MRNTAGDAAAARHNSGTSILDIIIIIIETSTCTSLRVKTINGSRTDTFMNECLTMLLLITSKCTGCPGGCVTKEVITNVASSV